ncbi:MAG: hypothetical protein ACP5QG_03580 [candidate division WOR-3 bacterium]
MKRGVFLFVLVGLACQRGDPVQIGLDYLTYIEEGKYDQAYNLIDKISRENTTKEDFVKYWEEQESKYGKPYKHEVVETGTDSGMIVIDYYWYYHPPADTHFYEPMRSYRLKLKRDFQGWRVKFRKYKIIKTPRATNEPGPPEKSEYCRAGSCKDIPEILKGETLVHLAHKAI